MNIYSYLKCDVANGDGLRVVCFFSGCGHHCEGCYSKETWKFSAGLPFDKQMQDQVIKDLSNPYTTGLTVSGGDCLHPRNAKDLLPFLQRVKLELPEKDIWCWSGHTFQELKNNLLQAQCLEYIDILVDGKFIKDLYEPDLLFRGSSNQQIIDVQKSLTTNKVCLYLDGNYK